MKLTTSNRHSELHCCCSLFQGATWTDYYDQVDLHLHHMRCTTSRGKLRTDAVDFPDICVLEQVSWPYREDVSWNE